MKKDISGEGGTIRSLIHYYDYYYYYLYKRVTKRTSTDNRVINVDSEATGGFLA